MNNVIGTLSSMLSYSLLSSIVMVMMYLAYKWLLADQSHHRFNRAMLYIIYAASGVLPLFYFYAPAIGDVHIDIGAPILVAAETTDTATALPSNSYTPLIAIGAYAIGVLTILGLSICAWQRLHLTVNRGEKRRYRGHNLVIIDDESIAPFSWCNNIVISAQDYAQNAEMILTHECCHIESRHQIDLIVAQLFIILQWFNPAAWLMRREFTTIHEYQADMSVLQAHCDARAYQLMLLKKAVGKQFPAFANSLNHSIIKKRITMMSNKKSSKLVKVGGFALVPAIALAIAVFNLPFVSSAMNSLSSAHIPESGEAQLNGEAPTATTSIAEAKVTQKFSQPEAIAENVAAEAPAAPADNAPQENVAKEDMPQFPGGYSELVNYLVTNIKWPDEAPKEGIDTKAVVKFTVKTDGAIADATIVKSSGDNALDNEAIRVVSSMPKWEPGRKDGVAVELTFTLPIMFRSKGE